MLFVLVEILPTKEKGRNRAIRNSQSISTEAKIINEQIEREKNNRNRSSPMESDLVFLVKVSVDLIRRPCLKKVRRFY